MKFILEENRLKGIVTKWLDKKYGGAEPFNFDISEHNIFYFKDNKVIFSIDPEWNFVRIVPEVFDTLIEYFGMTYDMSKEIISDWISKSYGLEETVVLKNVGHSREELFKGVERVYNHKKKHQ
jgi:hypothetical protein